MVPALESPGKWHKTWTNASSLGSASNVSVGALNTELDFVFAQNGTNETEVVF